MITVNMTITEKYLDGSVSSHNVILPYVISIKKITYLKQSIHDIEYDISINRVINIATEQTSWLLKSNDQFFAHFTVDDTPLIYQKVFFEFRNLPNGLIGN